MLEKLYNDLIELAVPADAEIKKRYFKTLEVGDVFIGISNPEVQKVFIKYEKKLSLDDVSELLKNNIHEVRYGALVLLVRLYERSKNIFDKHSLVDFYLNHVKYINNWDLVDCSCYKILGHYSYETKTDDFLEVLIEKESIWEKRIAIISTMYHIKKGDFRLAFIFIDKLLDHPHDLIHKAYGWMLKEIWSRGGNEATEEYIKENYTKIHRTSLRYAIEKMGEKQRKAFLANKV
jgi:3-methyladenine DNA glycosylase AlkD